MLQVLLETNNPPPKKQQNQLHYIQIAPAGAVNYPALTSITHLLCTGTRSLNVTKRGGALFAEFTVSALNYF